MKHFWTLKSVLIQEKLIFGISNIKYRNNGIIFTKGCDKHKKTKMKNSKSKKKEIRQTSKFLHFRRLYIKMFFKSKIIKEAYSKRGYLSRGIRMLKFAEIFFS